MKIALAGLIALALSAPVSSGVASGRFGVEPSEHPAVLRVDCMGSKGTAFFVSENILLSVDHVTRGAACYVGNKPIKVLHAKGDFSVLRAGLGGKWLRIDCGGFVPGRQYVAVGYARGRDTLTEIELVATSRYHGELQILEGMLTVIPGMSGGAVIDKTTGKVVGTINRFNAVSGESASFELRDTEVCRKA